jgi:geranylgeranyl pyrophosphate synthase
LLPTLRLYFEALRAGHAGQALDIKGFDHLMPDAIDDVNGGAERLEKAILACHFLKTAAPVALIIRAVALGSGGSAQEVDAVTSYFEAIGVAFQIMVLHVSFSM